MDLFDEFKTLVQRLNSEKIDYALCGGLAMAVYAFPRATIDIDLLIESESLKKVKAVANDLGYTLEAGMMKFRHDVIQIHRLTKVEAETKDTLMLDMLLVTPEIRDVWETKTVVAWDNVELPIVSIEGLIKLKTLRLSGQDKDDITNLKSFLNEN